MAISCYKAPQSYGLHHSKYRQSDNPFSNPSSYDYHPKQSSLEETFKEFKELIGQPTIPVPQEPSLEDTLEAFRQIVNQPCHEIKDQPWQTLKQLQGWKDSSVI